MPHIIRKIRKYFTTKKELTEQVEFFTDQIEELQDIITTLQDQRKDPRHAIQHTLKNLPKYYPYEDLKPAELDKYRRHAANATQNPTLKNEISYLIAEATKEAVNQAKTPIEMEGYRMYILGASDLVPRLLEIAKFDEPEPEDFDPREVL